MSTFYDLSYYYEFDKTFGARTRSCVLLESCSQRIGSLISKEHARKYPLMFISACQLYGCEIRLLTLREERKLKVFENWVLGRIFGPKRDEVAREWRKLHNEALNELCSSPILFG
jgi:hypothetical protein